MMFQHYFTCAWGKIYIFSNIQYSYVYLFGTQNHFFFFIKLQSHLSYFHMPFIVISSNFPSPSDVTVQKKTKKLSLSYTEHFLVIALHF